MDSVSINAPVLFLNKRLRFHTLKLREYDPKHGKEAETATDDI